MASRRAGAGTRVLAFLSIASAASCFVFFKRPSLRPSSRVSRLPRSVSLDYAQSLTGASGSRELISEFKRSYRENPFPEKLGLFFPDHDRILSLLYQSGRSNYTESGFLRTVDLVFRQLYDFGPSAWPALTELLDKKHPWTKAFCQEIIAEGPEVWSPFEFFSVNLDSLALLQRYAFPELESQSKTGFRVLEKWLQRLSEAAKADPQMQNLLEALKIQAPNRGQNRTKAGRRGVALCQDIRNHQEQARVGNLSLL